MFQQSKLKKAAPPRRYDVNRTLATYQPNSPQPAKAVTKQDTRPQSSSQPAGENKRRFGFKKALILLFVILLTPLLVIGFWDLRNASQASEKVFGSGNIAPLLLPSSLDNEAGRVNILLVGYSVDDPGHAGAALTDSIMVVSLDKEKKTGYMLSVPRDLYVSIPNYGSAKINEAYQAGENEGFEETGYPSGGIGLLQKVVSENFDIPVHYSVIVNYAAVREIVDALGGVSVNIQSPDPEGLYDPNFKSEEGGPLKLANGVQEIDGQTALRLTRARGATYGSYGFPQSDFNRTQNQQAVFAAIKADLDWKLVLDPRLNGRVFDALAVNTKTDLELGEVLPLFRLLTSVPDSSLQPINLTKLNDQNLLTSFQTRSGQSALIPAAGIDDFSEIQAAVQRLNQ